MANQKNSTHIYLEFLSYTKQRIDEGADSVTIAKEIQTILNESNRDPVNYHSHARWIRNNINKHQDVEIKQEQKTESKFDAKNYKEKELTGDALKKYCKEEGLNYAQVQSAKYVNHMGQKKFNVLLKPFDDNKTKEDLIALFREVIDESTRELPEHNPNVSKELPDIIDRVIISDLHVGMDTNKEGKAMFPTVWNEETIIRDIDIVCEKVLKYKKSEVLLIDDLGDLMDGFKGFTTRGGHALPQNMTDLQAAKIGVKVKMRMSKRLSPHYDRIIFNSVTNDNHGGTFCAIVNEWFKDLALSTFSNVETNVYNKFINHYYIGKHAKVLTHGKDEKHLKFGFKPFLDDKQITKIDAYLKHNREGNVFKSAEFIEFCKGDSHQMLFDFTTAQDFDYFNFPALSPCSEWVGTNYQEGRRGFVIQHIDKNSDETIFIPIWLGTDKEADIKKSISVRV